DRQRTSGGAGAFARAKAGDGAGDAGDAGDAGAGDAGAGVEPDGEAEGLPQVAPTRVERRAFGIATLSFALVNSIFGVVGLTQTAALRRSLGDLPALAHERHAGGSFFAVNAGLDMLYISAGALLFRSTTPMLRGFGAGVLAQGGFLLGFDSSSEMIYRFGGR
ncbi:MAG: hypothetical protein ABI193_06260, partial [Minicystis sp.]